MATNPLSYTGYDYDTLVQHITNIVAADSRFDNFRESAIAQTLIEIFAGCVDLVTSNLERRAEECFFDTAKLKSSIILLAKSLGYVVTRPIPAQAKLKIKMSGDMTGFGITSGDKLELPIWTSFTYDNESFLLKDSYTYTFTSADVNSISADGSDFEKYLTVDDDGDYIYVIQGEQKTVIIEGINNSQLGETFQLYKIEDTTFSNKYGSEDYDTPITSVKIGATSADATEYTIDRRSLINWESIQNSQLGNVNNICLLRSTPDENVELVFGDATYAALGASTSGTGASTTYDNIYIDYLSTNGKSSNRSGVINETLESDVTVTVNGTDITSNVDFLFSSNLTNGADMESIESIKLNAPNIYYSLDRLVTKNDYQTYLKSLTSPVNIRQALAWGEQEEFVTNDYEPIKKLFNIVFFCCLGSLYNVDTSPYSVRSMSNKLLDSLLDVDYDENGVPDQSYFNVYTKQDAVQQIKSYSTSGSYYTIIGDSDTTIDIDTFTQSYSATDINVYYGSDYYLTATSKLTTINGIDISGATSESDIATALKAELSAIVDERGTAGTNANYNQLAFENIDVQWDTTNERFVISGTQDDPCNIKYMYDNDGMLLDMGNMHLRMSTKNNVVSNEVVISDDITDTVDLLDTRSIITTKNIYVSPIIHNFNLAGKIYVKNLVDKNSLHTTIKDAIYSWLNTNVGFNSNIYISDIIDIVMGYSNVVNADIYFQPVSYTGTTSAGTYFDVDSETAWDKPIYADELAATDIPNVFSTQLSDYLTSGGNIEVDTETVTSTFTYNSTTLVNDVVTWANHITERTFFTQLVKNIYDNLSDSYEQPFRDSVDFVNVISKIHKDLSYIIKYNMLDTWGNIATETKQVTTNGVTTNEFYRGGYTMGNEIVKFNINTTMEYRT